LHERLRALVKLSEIDASGRAVDLQLQEIPARVAESRGDLARLEGLLSRERSDLAEAERLKKSHEDEIARHNESLGKSKAKAAKARNAREAEAVEREVEGARRSIKDREAERERLIAAMGLQRTAFAEHEGEFERLRAMLVEDEAKAQEKIAALEAERAHVTQGRNVFVVLVDKPTVRRYEQLREKKGTAVVEIVNGSCVGCRMALPPQMLLELQRAEQPDLAQCPHCRRFVYTKAMIED
jgi:predicted  nucleic acid-binding Zn-ribbon protein